MDEIKHIAQPIAAELRNFNDDFIASLNSQTQLLQTAIDKILNATGKHVRPILVLLTAKACGNVSDNAISSAVLLELLHTATLIHDDVIDETKQRRGVPSLNAIFDNRISVLVGDYILSTALIRSIHTTCASSGLSPTWEETSRKERLSSSKQPKKASSMSNVTCKLSSRRPQHCSRLAWRLVPSRLERPTK